MAENNKETKQPVSETAQAVEKVKAPAQSKAKDKEETVVVNKAALGKVLERLERLESMQDKSRVAWFDAKSPKKVLKRVKINMFDFKGKPKAVTGWETAQDEMYQDSNGVWHEKQSVILYFEDGSSAEMSYIDRVRKLTRIDAEVLSSSRDEATGNVTLKVALVDSGRELEIDERFIN